MPDADTIHRMRVLWNKGRNFYSSFFTELANVQRELGDEQLADWCLWKLNIDLSICHRIATVLKQTDAERVRRELAKAQQYDAEQKRRERLKEQEQHDLSDMFSRRPTKKKSVRANLTVEEARKVNNKARQELRASLLKQLYAEGPQQPQLAALLTGSADVRHDLLALGKCYSEMRRMVTAKEAGNDERGEPWAWKKWAEGFIVHNANRRIRNKLQVVNDLADLYEKSLDQSAA